jgi:hypothetical protein
MYSEDAILWMTISWNTACMKNSDASAKTFMWQDTASHTKVEKCVDNGDFLRKNLNFIKNVPMIHVKFITNVSKVSDKRKKRHYFCTGLINQKCYNNEPTEFCALVWNWTWTSCMSG